MIHRVDEIIESLLEQNPGQQKYWLCWFRSHWHSVVGKQLGDHSWPLRLDRRVMLVGVDSSVWNQALFIKKRELLEHMAVLSEPFHMEDLKSIVTEKPSPWPLQSMEKEEEPTEPDVSEETFLLLKNEAEECCKGVQDPGLRELLERITVDLLLFHKK